MMRWMHSVLAVVLVLCVAIFSDARPPRGGFSRGGSTGGWQASTGPAYRPVPNTAVEALAHVNARRAQKGLRPYILDPLLTQGAMNAASCRAALGCGGHLQNDFAALPPGSPGCVGGCGVIHPNDPFFGNMWLSCASDDNYTYAGAAYAIGPDSRKYMHLFCR